MTQEAVRRSPLERALDGIERVGNKVPHPVVIFLALIAVLLVLSHVFYATDASVTFDQAEPPPGAGVVAVFVTTDGPLPDRSTFPPGPARAARLHREGWDGSDLARGARPRRRPPRARCRR